MKQIRDLETFLKKLIILMDYFNYFQDFILEHYSEDGAEYENEIADLMDLRQVSWLCLIFTLVCVWGGETACPYFILILIKHNKREIQYHSLVHLVFRPPFLLSSFNFN